MLNRRDIASIACYGLLFAAVVLWAELRPTSPNLLDARDSVRTSMDRASTARQVDLSDDQPEMRRVVKHMRIP